MSTRTSSNTTNHKPVRKARRFFIAIGFELREEFANNEPQAPEPPPALPFAGRAIAALPSPGLRKTTGDKVVQLFPFRRTASGR